MTDLQNLYQQSILDHYRKPRNFRKPEHANRQAEGHNPFCGDKISVFLQIENGIIREIGFLGEGCAISISSASMMTESLKGKSEGEANVLIERFCRFLTNRSEDLPEEISLGSLSIFSSVRGYPVRVKCATLPGTPCKLRLEVFRKQ